MAKNIVFLFIALFLFGCSTNKTLGEAKGEPQTVKAVDLERYAGKWYEIARLPFYWQNDCVGTTATYSLKENGEIEVLNECKHQTLTGKHRSYKGKARAVDRKSKSKLEVQFFWPFWGGYWILDLAEDYSYALVGTPDRKYLWVLSRTPTMRADTLRRLVAKGAQQGYDVKKMFLTPQAL